MCEPDYIQRRRKRLAIRTEFFPYHPSRDTTRKLLIFWSFRIDCGLPQHIGVTLELVGSVIPLSPLRERDGVRGTRGGLWLPPTLALPRRGGGRKASGRLLTVPARRARLRYTFGGAARSPGS